MGKNEHRMYGIGCSLDVAGTRFSAILIMIADRLCTITKDKDRRNRVILYLTAFGVHYYCWKYDCKNYNYRCNSSFDIYCCLINYKSKTKRNKL